jgi:hypothetical protein
MEFFAVSSFGILIHVGVLILVWYYYRIIELFITKIVSYVFKFIIALSLLTLLKPYFKITRQLSHYLKGVYFYVLKSIEYKKLSGVLYDISKQYIFS